MKLGIFFIIDIQLSQCRDSFITDLPIIKNFTLNSLESLNNSASKIMFKNNNTDVGKNIPATIYLFEVIKRNTRRCKICSELPIKKHQNDVNDVGLMF